VTEGDGAAESYYASARQAVATCRCASEVHAAGNLDTPPPYPL